MAWPFRSRVELFSSCKLDASPYRRPRGRPRVGVDWFDLTGYTATHSCVCVCVCPESISSLPFVVFRGRELGDWSLKCFRNQIYLPSQKETPYDVWLGFGYRPTIVVFGWFILRQHDLFRFRSRGRCGCPVTRLTHFDHTIGWQVMSSFGFDGVLSS